MCGIIDNRALLSGVMMYSQQKSQCRYVCDDVVNRQVCACVIHGV